MAVADSVATGSLGRRGAAAPNRPRRLLLYGFSADVGASVVAVAVAVAAGWFDRPATRIGAAAMIVVLIGGIAFRQRDCRLGPSAWEDVCAVLGTAWIATVLGIVVQALVADGPAPSAGTLLAIACVEVVSVAGVRAATAGVRRRALRGMPTLIIGAGYVGHLVATRLLEQPGLGLVPVGYLDKDPRIEYDPESRSDLPVLGASWDLEDVVRAHDIRYVVVTFSTAPTDVLLSLLRRCESLGIDVALVPRLFEKVSRRVAVHHLGGLPLLQINQANPKGWAFDLKHVLDRLGAAILIPLLAPALVFSATSVWLSLGRPILFRQRRIGRDGKPFDMLKFRTMKRGSPPSTAESVFRGDVAPGGVEGDDRRTPIGALLRRTSLDELPQLFNVLKGDMSFVGPRPERPEFVEIFNQDVYRYGDRHRVKSGITGWSQVNGLRGKTSIRDRAEWDNYYIENWSFGMDLRILASTVRAMFSPGTAE